MTGRFRLPLGLCVCALGFVAWAETGAGHDRAPDPVQRLWVEKLDGTRTSQARIEVHVASQYTLPASVLWQGTVVATETFDDVVAELTVTSPDGEPLSEGSVQLDVRPGENPFTLTWTPGALEDGIYQAQLKVERSEEMVLATQDYRIRQISESNLTTLLESLESDSAQLRDHLATHAAGAALSPYATMRFAIAEDYLPIVKKAFDDGSWRRAQDDGTFLAKLLAAARVELAFRPAGEAGESSPSPLISDVSVENARFVSQQRPVFLFGATGAAEELAASLPSLRRYGLNLVATRVGPADTLPSRGGNGIVPADLLNLFDGAKKESMGVSVSLAPNKMAPWAYESWPALAEHHAGTFPYDISHPKVQPILAQHTRTIVQSLANRDALVSIAVADRPEMQFMGEPVRQGLIAFAKQQYGDRTTMNRIWGTLYLNFDEVKLSWDYERPAYRHDLELYEQKLGSIFLDQLIDMVRKQAPDVPVQVNFTDRVFDPGESAFGVNRETVERKTDISGCMASEDLGHSYLALGYPSQSLNYTLLRSMNRGAPVFNAEDTFVVPSMALASTYEPAAYALEWEGAMAGLDASTAPLGSRDGNPQTLLGRPQRLEGFARACLDLNRLAPIVNAFQDSAPEVSILWSMSSKVYNDGVPYLESVKRAYEGCHTFGFKVEFLTEEDCEGGALDRVKILVIPDVLSMSDKAFLAVDKYISNGGIAIRQGKPIAYNPSGLARQDTLTTSARTILIQGIDSPTSYLHALDAACALNGAPSVPRAINASQYPLEGVKTRFVEYDGNAYLYAINLRKTAETVYLAGRYASGLDLIGGATAKFPMTMNPLEPMLLRLDTPDDNAPAEESSEAPKADDVPLGIVEPIHRAAVEEKPAPRPHRRHGTR